MLYFLNNLWYAKLKIGILYHVVILSLVVGLAVGANKEFLSLSDSLVLISEKKQILVFSV